MPTPSCFISYSRDGAAHETWVRHLGTRLMQTGIETRLDQWDLRPGSDLIHYMENSVQESDFVLLVCTPSFAQKANTATGGVGYEKAIVSASLFENYRTEKFIPLLRSGTQAESLPLYLKSRVYIDFRDDAHFEEQLVELVRAIRSQPLFVRPPLGSAPFLDGTDSSLAAAQDSTSAPPAGSEFTTVYKFAWARTGLNLQSRHIATTWAQRWLSRRRSANELEWFRTLYVFSYGGGGLNCSTEVEALEWAETLFEAVRPEEFARFREQFAFASSTVGLRMPRLEAARWALANLHPLR